VTADAAPRSPYLTPGIVSLAQGGPYVGYDSGGWLPPGMTAAVNMTGKPEAVLTADDSAALKELVRQMDRATSGRRGGSADSQSDLERAANAQPGDARGDGPAPFAHARRRISTPAPQQRGAENSRRTE
jgi:hypothetical protein